ncbi:unnamed protein product, partial [Sphacelaria rigidula]
RFSAGFRLRRRVLGCLGVSTLSFVSCAVLALAEGLSANFLFFATMVLVLTSGMSIAVMQGDVFAMVSAFPPRYTQAMVSGQSLSGLAVALAGILISLAGPDDDSCVRAQEHNHQEAFTSGLPISGALGHIVEQQFAGRRFYGQALTSAALHEEYFSGDVYRWLDDSMPEVMETVENGSDFFEQPEPSAFQTLSLSTLPSTITTVAVPKHRESTIDGEPTSVEVETLVRYSIAITVLLACMVTFVVLERLPITVFYVTQEQLAIAAAEEEERGGSSNNIRRGDRDANSGRTTLRQRGELCRCDGCEADSWKPCCSTNFSNNGDPSLPAASSIAVSDGLAASPLTRIHHSEGQRQHQLQQPILPVFSSVSEEDLSRHLLSHLEHDNDNDAMVSALRGEYLKEGKQRRERNTSDASKLERGSSSASLENISVSSFAHSGTATISGREAKSRVLPWKMWRRWVRQTTDTYGPISRCAFCVFFCFTVSISLYPATTSEIVSTRRCTPGRARFFSEDTFMLFSFVSYNAFDFLGRLVAGYTGLSFSLLGALSVERWLLPAAVCRIVFIPLLLACRTTGSSSSYSSRP